MYLRLFKKKLLKKVSDSPKNVLSINEGQNKKLPEGHINIL